MNYLASVVRFSLQPARRPVGVGAPEPVQAEGWNEPSGDENRSPGSHREPVENPVVRLSRHGESAPGPTMPDSDPGEPGKAEPPLSPESNEAGVANASLEHAPDSGEPSSGPRPVEAAGGWPERITDASVPPASVVRKRAAQRSVTPSVQEAAAAESPATSAPVVSDPNGMAINREMSAMSGKEAGTLPDTSHQPPTRPTAVVPEGAGGQGNIAAQGIVDGPSSGRASATPGVEEARAPAVPPPRPPGNQNEAGGGTTGIPGRPVVLPPPVFDAPHEPRAAQSPPETTRYALAASMC